jgi:biopolymer transport protein ExbB/TolQ
MTYERPQETLRKRATRAIIENAIFDWKSGVVIALTILFTAFSPIEEAWRWYYLAGGIVMWLALFLSIMTDPAANAKAVADLLRHDFDPKQLRSEAGRGRIDKALEYRQRIAETVARTRDGVLRGHLRDMAGQIDDWIGNLYQLAQRLDAFESDDVIHQDMRSVPQAIQNLQAKMRTEHDASVVEQMKQTLESKQAQQANLQQLESMMQKAELQMDSTLTAMGTIYSQLLIVGVKDIDSGRAQRLREDISEQVKQLQDVVSSMDEVYRAKA